jgi:Ca-activated chloride channel family protein
VIFRFAHPEALLLLMLPVIIVGLARLGYWRHIPSVMRYSDTRLVSNLPISWRARLRRTPDVLRLCAWALLVIALARPQSGQAQEIIRGQGIDMVLALDISGSMAALDFDPQNRLQAAKSVIADFITGREYDRIGLVVFARDAFHHAPPTLDYGLLLQLLDEVQLAPDIGLDDGTAIGLGLASAANMLRTNAVPTRLVILLTDGANNSGGVDPITAAQALAAVGIRVYTIGMGRPGLVPVPVDNQGNTRVIESDLDEGMLIDIAAITNGRYFRAIDLDDLEAVYDQINTLEQTDIERQVYVRWQEQAMHLLVISLAVLVTERILRYTIFQTIP